MTKAEERAFEYQMSIGPNVIGGAGLLSEDEFKKLNTNCHFKAGYEQAEKDNVLTIEDIERLHTFLYAVKNSKSGCFTFTRLSDEQYQEVLRKFNDLKEKEK